MDADILQNNVTGRVTDDEGHLQKSRGGPLQGVLPQPAPSLCPDLLPGLPGRGAAGGRAGALQRGDHPDLFSIHRRRVCPADESAGTYFLAATITE